MARVHEGMMTVSEKKLTSSRRIYLAENAVAAAIFSLGTGNFMMGLLSWMGASPATCALIGAFPQLGCIMQLVSPFLFERLPRRKPYIILCCFLFRFLLGCVGVVPLLFFAKTAAPVVPLYLAAFLMAGFVTPGLSQWVMDLAPSERRGNFFARRDILSSIVNAGIILLMSRLLDQMIASGQTREGYLAVFSTVVCLSVVNALLLTRIVEPQDSNIVKLKPVQLLRPFRDPRFVPILVFIVLWFFTQNLSSGFLSVYLLTELHLDHSMIATMTVISSVVGILMSWIWGAVADRVGWRTLPVYAGLLMGTAYCGWFLLPTSLAFLAPVLQCIATAGSSAYNMSILNIQYTACPPQGKTAYLGVTAAVSNLVGYSAVFLGAQIQPILGQYFQRSGIPILFAASAVGFFVCILYSRRIAEV